MSTETARDRDWAHMQELIVAFQQQVIELGRVGADLAHSVRTQHHRHQTKDEWVEACGFLPPDHKRLWREPIEWCLDCQLLARWDALTSHPPLPRRSSDE